MDIDPVSIWSSVLLCWAQYVLDMFMFLILIWTTTLWVVVQIGLGTWHVYAHVGVNMFGVHDDVHMLISICCLQHVDINMHTSLSHVFWCLKSSPLWESDLFGPINLFMSLCWIDDQHIYMSIIDQNVDYWLSFMGLKQNEVVWCRLSLMAESKFHDVRAIGSNPTDSNSK